MREQEIIQILLCIKDKQAYSAIIYADKTLYKLHLQIREIKYRHFSRSYNESSIGLSSEYKHGLIHNGNGYYNYLHNELHGKCIEIGRDKYKTVSNYRYGNLHGERREYNDCGCLVRSIMYFNGLRNGYFRQISCKHHPTISNIVSFYKGIKRIIYVLNLTQT